MDANTIPVIFAGRRPMPDTIRIGMREDNEVETIRFTLPQIGDGQLAYLYMTLPGGGDVADITDGMLTITRTHTAVAGVIDAHVEILCGNQSWHSEPLHLVTGDTTRGGEQVAKQYPSAMADALTRANAAAWRAESATGAGAPPIICAASGMTIAATDSADRPLRALTVYGRTVQDGTPSEDAPAELKSVGDAGDVVVSVMAGLPEGGTDQIAIIRQPRDVTAPVGGMATFGVFAVGRGLTYQWMVSYDGGNTWQASIYSEPQNPYLTFTVKTWHDGYKYRCVITDASGNTITTDTVTLTIGEASGSDDAAGDTQTATISTLDGQRGVPVASGAGTYTDTDGQGWIADTVEYDAETGTAQIVRRVGSVTFDGSADEDWGVAFGYNALCVNVANAGRVSNGICTHFKGADISSDQSAIGFSAAIEEGLIVFRPAGYETLTIDDWRARLAGSPVTVLYALSEPVEQEITTDEFAEMSALRSRYPETTMYNDAEAHMAARYVADTKNYVDQRIEQLTNALVSTGANI